MRKRAGSGASWLVELNFSSGVCGVMSESSSGEKRIRVAIGLVTNCGAVTGFSTGAGGFALGIRKAGGADGRSFKAG